MTEDPARRETFEEFCKSFSYGTRNDLAFKFLSKLPAGAAARFFEELLEGLGATIDDGDTDRLIQLAYEWQVRGYEPDPKVASRWSYAEGPFTLPARPVAQSRVALMTSSGHFAAGDDPAPFGVEDMTQLEAVERISDFLRSAPRLSEIPRDTPDADLRVRHGGYDIRGAAADPGVTFPLRLLRDLEAEGVIGELAPNAYSFPGATAQGRILNDAGPEWAEQLRESEVDVVVLVPV